MPRGINLCAFSKTGEASKSHVDLHLLIPSDLFSSLLALIFLHLLATWRDRGRFHERDDCSVRHAGH